MQIVIEYLKLAGMSQVDLAKKAKIEPSLLNNILHKRKEPGLKTLKKLSEATGISLDKLVNGE